MEPEDAGSSSDMEYEIPNRSYGEYLHKLLPPRTYDEHVDGSHSDHEPSVNDSSEDEEVVSVPDDDGEPEKVTDQGDQPTPDDQPDEKPGSKNIKPDALSCQFATEPSASTKETIIPKAIVMGALMWEMERWIKEVLVTNPDSGGGPPGHLFIPAAIRGEVIHWLHTAKFSCHPGVARTLSSLQCMFSWPSMEKNVQEYIKACPQCSTGKSPTKPPASLLQPLPIPSQPLANIALDFITGLPLSKGHTMILTAADQFSKAVHFVPLKKLPSALETAQLFNHVVRLYSITVYTVSDRGPQFISQEEIMVPSITAHMSRCRCFWKDAEADLLRSVQENARWANRKRHPAPTYEVGQRVWLSTKNFPLKTDSKRLAPRFMGPFTIKDIINPVSTGSMATIMAEAETRQRLLRTVKKEVKQIMEEAVTRKFVHEDSSHIVSLCAAVEACVLHGLKRRAAGFLRSNKIAALFMKVGKSFPPAEELCRKAQELEQIIETKRSQSLQSQDSLRKMPRLPSLTQPLVKNLWIRTALFEKVLDKIVLYLVENSSKYYEKEAILMDPVDGPILASLLVGPCALEYTKMKTADHFWTDPSADELVQRHRIHGGHCRQDSPTKRPALCIQKRHSSSSMDERPSPSPSAREYVESLHQNNRATLLFGKNNVLVQPRDDMEAIPGYLSLHQTADIMTLKWTPNQLMNGSVGDLDYERSVYWDYAMTVPLGEIVYLHCHQQVDSGGTVVLVSQDGIQRPPFRFPKGGHLLQFLSCLENGLLPHGQLDPPLWSQRGKGKVFPKLRKRVPQGSGSTDSVSDKDEDEATDYVFRILFPNSQSEFVTPPDLMDQGATMWHPTLRKSSCSSCSQGSFSDAATPKGCNHERAPLKLLCDNMKYQIISRAFYGWLAYCRHLSTVRTHLSALVNHTIVAPDMPCDAYGGLTTTVWQTFLQDCTAYKEQELLRLVYFGGVDPTLRKEVWPFLLGHYQFGMSEIERKEVDEQVRVCYQQTMREWLGCEEIVRQREKEQHAVALAKCSTGASTDSCSQKMKHHDSTVSNESQSSQSSDRQSLAHLQSDSSTSTQVFESVEEVDQIEMEPKTEEAKQVPKMPNGALQNGTSSPDSGHPSSRNFSVTSGLSDGSFSTEDSAVAVHQASQSSIKPEGGESEGLTQEMDSQVKNEVKDKGGEKEKANNLTKMAKNAEAINDIVDTKDSHLNESGTSKTEETKSGDKSLDKNITGVELLETGREAKVSSEEPSKLKEANEEKVKDANKSKMSKEVLHTEGKEKMSKSPQALEMESPALSADTRVLRAREAYCASQKDEALVLTESDESPSAIEMEEIPKAKVSMVPWSRTGHCETSSSSEDSAPHLQLRKEEEEGKLSPEGTESILSEPEMESLYPTFDSLAASENTKNQVTSQETAGSTFSQELLDLYTLNLHRIEKDVQRCDRNYWYFNPANLEKLRNIMCSYIWKHLDIGYVQGMCDLLAPLLVILDDEALAFSCFTELMKRMNQNFPHGGAMDTHFAYMRSLIQILDSELFELMHQNGDYTHFYFCYRWFLLDFKRELVYDDVFAVWETIWAAKYVSSSHFVLFIALALVEMYRDIILENNMDFTDIIKFFNEMAERHDVKRILTVARDLVCKVQMLIENK
ncbi:small G protein signaling modulator 1 [Pholidichthys leucotaenia]